MGFKIKKFHNLSLKNKAKTKKNRIVKILQKRIPNSRIFILKAIRP
jgi:hypothetical protein